jgi:hypothetical protein
MDKLRLKYKLAIIPKDTILFRKAPDNGIYESMYFSFNSSGTYSTDFNSGPIQQWKTKQTIISHFIVKGKISPLIYKTDLEYCYQQFCGEDKCYLDVKHRNNPKCKDFLAYLKKNGIDSWVTSVHNGTDVELHLFTENNKNLIQFKQNVDNEKNRIIVNKDSFNKVTLLDLKDYI